MPFYYTLLLHVTNMLSRKRTDTTHPANASFLSDCTNYIPTASNFSIFVLLTGKFCLLPSISHCSSLFTFEFCFWKNLRSWMYKPELSGAQTCCVCLFMPTLLHIHWQRCGEPFFWDHAEFGSTTLHPGRNCPQTILLYKQFCFAINIMPHCSDITQQIMINHYIVTILLYIAMNWLMNFIKNTSIFLSIYAA